MLDAAQRVISGRQQAYKKTFVGPLAKKVLADLAVFCRATETTFHQDARLTGILEGRREVWLRIQDHIQLSESDLFALLQGQPVAQRRAQREERET